VITVILGFRRLALVLARINHLGSVADGGCAWCEGLEAAHARLVVVQARQAAERAERDRVSSELRTRWFSGALRLVHVNAGSY
jgi:hypothetical protein